MKHTNTLTFPLLLGLLILLMAHLPFFILGENSFITIHDNLDSDFIYLHVLKISGNLFSFDGSTPISNIFNGLERSYIHSEFSFIRVLFYFLPSFWAYVINSFLVRTIGFLGILLLAKDYFPAKNRTSTVLLIGLTFSILPIYPLYGLTVMGQPLLFWAFLNLSKNKKKILSFSLIILFPFYSHFALLAPFVLIAIFLYGFYFQFFLKQKINFSFWIGIGTLFLFFILANINLILGFLDATKVSHRTEWVLSSPGPYDTIKTIVSMLFSGQDHSSKIFSLPIILLVIYAFIKKTTKSRSALTILLIIFGISVFWGIYTHFAILTEDYISLLSSFQFNRFTFFIPFLFLLILLILNQDAQIKKSVIYLTSILSLLFVLQNELVTNYIKLIKPSLSKKITFQAFFSQNLFKQIEQHIEESKKDFRVVSLGMSPSIAQYNGFYTLDSYQNNYPLSYKKNFRLLIEKELDKNEELKKYFDDWGNRCYIFSSELKNSCYLNCKKDSNVEIQNLALNTEKLLKMGAHYIISAVPILNSNELNISLEKIFEDNISSWKIHLYKIKQEKNITN